MFDQSLSAPENLSLTPADRSFLFLHETKVHDEMQVTFYLAADHLANASELAAKARALKTRANRRRLLYQHGRFQKPIWE